VKGWDGTCPKCRTDERLEVFEMPKVPMGQVVIKVEGEWQGRGGGGGGAGGGCGEGERRKDVEDVRGWWVFVRDEDDRHSEEAQIHNIDIVWHYCPELGC